MRKKNVTLLGRYYDTSDPKQMDQFADWFLQVMEEAGL